MTVNTCPPIHYPSSICVPTCSWFVRFGDGTVSPEKVQIESVTFLRGSPDPTGPRPFP